MEFNELLIKRRSTRSYENKKVPLDLIKLIIEETRYAPSWKNGENTRYYLAYEDETINEVITSLPSFNQNNSKNAVYIISSFVSNKSGFDLKTNLPINEVGQGFGYYDNGLKDAYLVLCAKNHGVDSLIMGLRDSEKLRKALYIPENEIITSVIALGYGNYQIPEIKRKSCEEILKIK